jgi:mannose/fructose-specific phosphotransferase system component IIA
LTRQSNGQQSEAIISIATHKEIIVLTFLWIASVILVVAGIAALVKRQVATGIVLIVLGLLVGPGGVSIVG